MANFLQELGSFFGLSDSQPLVSAALPAAGTVNAAFTLDVNQPGATGEQVLIAAPGDATLMGQGDTRNLILGGTGNDRLVGGDHNDLLAGGGGTNVLSGAGGTDTFTHQAGATDILTDFSPSAGEHIALATGLTLTGSAVQNVNPGDFSLGGATTPSTILTFGDNSQVILLHETGAVESGWFV